MARRAAAAISPREWPAEASPPWAGAAYKPLYTLLAEHLEGRIRAGQFAEGAYLPGLRDMMRLFRVGLSTARGAVRELARRGLVDVRHGSGIRVILRGAPPAGREAGPLDVAQDIRDLFAVREMLETAALKSAMGAMDAAPLVALFKRTAGAGKAQKRMTPEVRRAVFEVDKRMHDEIFSKCPNPHLREALAEVMRRIELYREINFRRLYARGSEEDRRTIGAIVDAIAAGDAEAADAALRTHIRFTRDRLLEFVPGHAKKG